MIGKQLKGFQQCISKSDNPYFASGKYGGVFNEWNLNTGKVKKLFWKMENGNQ